MAVSKISFDVYYQQNRNSYTSAYGKYYAFPNKTETLDLKGLINRVAFGQSVYSRDIVEGVIQKLTTDMVELLQSGQAVKWNGLGTFTPTVENDKGGITQAQLLAGDKSVDEVVKGIHIRFVPENSKGEELTSRAFKESVQLNVVGVRELTTITEGTKKTNYAALKDLDTWKYEVEHPAQASGGSGGGDEEIPGQGGNG